MAAVLDAAAGICESSMLTAAKAIHNQQAKKMEEYGGRKKYIIN